jgi:hypothetical protein
MRLGSRLSVAGCAFYHGARPALASLPLPMLVTACGGSTGASAWARASASISASPKGEHE